MSTISGNNTGAVSLTTIPNESAQGNYIIGNDDVGSVYAFTRARMVSFIAQALKPNTVYHPFFNDVWVGEYCTVEDQPDITDSGKIDGLQRTLKTDSLGNLTGNFYIPANTFASGSLVFKLVDSKTELPEDSGLWFPDPIYGSAEATYESGTVLKETQNQLTINAEQGVGTKVTPVVGEVLSLPPITTHKAWYFEYTLTDVNSSTFTITTTSASPPSPQAQTGSVEFPAGATNVVNNIATVAVGDGTYLHTFTYSSSGAPRTLKFRQEWIGLDGETPPSLVGFRPTGIAASVTCTVTTPWTERAGSVVGPQNYGRRITRKTDPIAQSFNIDSKSYPNGIFVTSIGVYFKTVDHAAQAIMELRTMENGLPSSQILPGGVAIVPGRAAQASSNGTVPTIFRFAHPIYLMPSSTYCFTLKSSSLGYTVWTSIVGKIDAASGKVIDSNPYAGTLFKSQNNYTWIPSPLEDLKFDLYKANFDTSAPATLIFTPREFTIDTTTGEYASRDPLDADLATNYYSVAQTLPLSHITTIKQGVDVGTYLTGVSDGDISGKTVQIKIPLHSTVEGDFIFLRGVPTPTKVDEYHGIRADQFVGAFEVQGVIDSDHVLISVSGVGSNLAATKSGPLSLPETYGVLSNEPSIWPHIPSMVDAQQFFDPSSKSMNIVPATTESFVQKKAPIEVSKYHFVVYTNVRINEANLDYVATTVKTPAGAAITSITEDVRVAGIQADGTYLSITGPETDAFDSSSKFVHYDTPRILANPLNEYHHSIDLGEDVDLDYPTTCKITVELDSISGDVSPTLDLSGANLLVRTYRIDNQGFEFIDSVGDPVINTTAEMADPALNSELAPSGGVALAKYKSKINQLGSTYNAMKIFVTGNCPAEPGGVTAFDVYMRTSSDDTTHEDLPWTWLANLSDTGEATLAFENSPNRTAVNEWYYELPDSVGYFSVFDIKIVMRTTNTSYVPKIFGIRTIASIKLPTIE